MRIRVLGAVEVESDSDKPIGGPTQRRLLAVLAMRAGDIVSAEQLIELTWPDGDRPKRPEHNLHTYLHRLRQAMGSDGDRLVNAGPGYRLSVGAAELDSLDFERLIDRLRRADRGSDSMEALEASTAAVELWRGRPYEEFADEAWARGEVARLSEMWLDLIERRAALLVGAGRASDAVAELEAAIAQAPMRDGLRAQLMQALYHGGRQADALRAFQDYRRVLIDEVGVDPTDDLVDLDRAIATGDLDPPGAKAATIRGGCEIHERIGSGAFAEVFRGTQPTLGREVAIKVVRPELANSPDFIRGFEAEASMIARLEHPHIVPLYDFWREPDRALLVMRWLTGGSLEARLDDGPGSLEDTARVVEQVGSALAFAHRAGVVHRDVKAANILLDDDNNAYLTDFGIAVDSVGVENPAALRSEGSPAYASPEQLRREHVGPAADIYGLAITVYEMLAGRLPFAGVRDRAELLQRQLHEPIPPLSAVRPELPRQVEGVLAKATAKDPDERHADVSEFVASLVDAMATAPGASSQLRDAAVRVTELTGAIDNPYKGLRAFDEGDADEFHGRDLLVGELLSNLADNTVEGNFVAVVGPSGSGKSSVVRAGLIPALRQGRIPGSDEWFITTMTPGSRPYESLETALLRVAVNPPASLLEQLGQDRRGILRACRRILPTENASVVIVIDQFEELFTHNVDPDERAAFLESIAVAATDAASPVRVVVTLRADFFDHPLRHPEIASLMKQHTVTVTPLTPDELEQAVVRPAETASVRFEPGLVAEITADVASQPGALPLMQYALSQLFERRISGLLTLDTYRELGGLRGALAQQSEELYQSLDTDCREASRRLFGRLVSLGEGTEDTRRRVPIPEFSQDTATETALASFADARLLTFDRDPATRTPTVELAHEALIREWPRLRDWLDQDREALYMLRSVTHAADLWEAGGSADSDLLRGNRLDTAEALLTSNRVRLNNHEQDFVHASTARRDTERRSERQRARRLRTLAAATSVIAVIALVAGLVAFTQWNRADDRATEAQEVSADLEDALQVAQDETDAATEARQDAEDARARSGAAATTADAARLVAVAGAEPDPTVGLLMALEAHLLSPSSESLSAIHAKLIQRPGFFGRLDTGPVGPSIGVLDNGDRIAITTTSTVEVWDLTTRSRVWSWPIPQAEGLIRFGLSVTADPNGQFVTATAPTSTYLLDAETGSLTATIEHPDVGRSSAVSPDGTISIHELDQPRRPWATLRANETVSRLAWSPDGRLLATGTDAPSLAVWDTRTTEQLWELQVTPTLDRIGASPALVFATGGDRLVTSIDTIGGGWNIRVLDPETGDNLRDPIPDTHQRASLSWSNSSESTLVAGAWLGGVAMIDLQGSGQSRPIVSPDSISSVAVALPDRDRVIVAGDAGMELYSLSGSNPLAKAVELTREQRAARVPDDSIVWAAFDEAEGLLTTYVYPCVGTTPSECPNAQIYDIEDLPARPALHVIDGAPAGFVWGGPTWVVSIVGDQLLVRDGLFGPVRGSIPFLPGATELRWSLDGSLIARADDGEIVVFRVDDAAVVAEIAAPGDGRDAQVHFSRDGRLLVVSTPVHGTALYEMPTGRQLNSSSDFSAAVLNPDGSLLATSDATGLVVLRDPTSLEPLGDPLVGHEGLVRIWQWSPDGRRLFTMSTAGGAGDGTARVWDVLERTQIGAPLPESLMTRIWSQDGNTLIGPLNNGVGVWNYDTTTWADIACEIAGRNMTQREWEAVGPRTIQHRATCPQYPL